MRCVLRFVDVIPNTRKARVRNLLFAAFLLGLASSVAAQAKRPFTFEDMMKLKRVSDPQVSPDGKWVIFSVVDVDLEANTKTPHVWIVPLAGGEADASSAPERSSAGSSSAERILIADQDADRPRWAPDGKRFAFLSTKEGGSQVWIAEFDTTSGGVTRVQKLTSIATEASGELWSPRGESILFTSDVYPECDNGSPAAEASCNAAKVKDVEQSKVKAQVFTHLLYRHWNAYKEGKRSHIFVEWAEPLPEIKIPPGEVVRLPGNFELHLPRDLTPGDYDAPVFSLGGQDDYAFSPDGQEICYTSNHDQNPATSTNNDLWVVPVNFPFDAKPADVLAKTKNITADNPASDSSPLYSPDGRYIAYRAQQRPGYESDRFRLMLYDRKTGEKKNLTEDFDRWVGAFMWRPDSRSVLFASEDAGSSPIFRRDLSPLAFFAGEVPGSPPSTPLQLPDKFGGWPVEIVRGFNDDVTLVDWSKTILFTRMSLDRPSEIYTARPVPVKNCGPSARPSNASGYDDMECEQYEVVQLTHVNESVLSEVAMAPLESFWFTGAHSDKVEGFLVKPPNFDASKKYPVKFLIHGGPQGAWGDDWSYRWNPELFASPTSSASSGYVVIMINFHGSTGYGQKFIDAINGDWGGAPFEDLMKGLDYAEEHYPFIDKNRECALGASYGGYAINWILGHTDRFKCLVSHDGMFNAESAWGSTEEVWFNDWEFKGTPYDNRASYEKWSPHQYAKNFKTPTLVIHGQRDYRLDVSEGFQLFTTLQMEGVPSKMLYFPDEGHWVLKPQNSQLWYKTVNDWVDQWIGK
jgi:dipeptidyl aminopeptidase/acylaminoacyl peptidase